MASPGSLGSSYNSSVGVGSFGAQPQSRPFIETAIDRSWQFDYGQHKTKCRQEAAEYLDERLQALAKSREPENADGAVRQDAIKRLQDLLAVIFPPPSQLRLVPYGSFLSSCYSRGSDLDLALAGAVDQRIVSDNPLAPLLMPAATIPLDKLSDKQWVALLRQMADSLERNGMTHGPVTRILEARVPIIKFIESRSGIECDICVTTRGCDFKGDVMRELHALQPCLAPLIRLVKLWAKQHDINSAHCGTLNSWSLALMALFSLQSYPDGHLLPPLWRLFHDEEPSGPGGAGRPLQDKSMPLEVMLAVARRRCTPGHGPRLLHPQWGRDVPLPGHLPLLLWFFSSFAAITGQWRDNAMNRNWRVSPWLGRGYTGRFPKAYVAAVEEPFDSNDNTARSVGVKERNENTLPYIAWVFGHSVHLLRSVQDVKDAARALAWLFGPDALPFLGLHELKVSPSGLPPELFRVIERMSAAGAAKQRRPRSSGGAVAQPGQLAGEDADEAEEEKDTAEMVLVRRQAAFRALIDAARLGSPITSLEEWRHHHVTSRSKPPTTWHRLAPLPPHPRPADRAANHHNHLQQLPPPPALSRLGPPGQQQQQPPPPPPQYWSLHQEAGPPQGLARPGPMPFGLSDLLQLQGPQQMQWPGPMQQQQQQQPQPFGDPPQGPQPVQPGASQQQQQPSSGNLAGGADRPPPPPLGHRAPPTTTGPQPMPNQWQMPQPQQGHPHSQQLQEQQQQHLQQQQQQLGLLHNPQVLPSNPPYLPLLQLGQQGQLQQQLQQQFQTQHQYPLDVLQRLRLAFGHAGEQQLEPDPQRLATYERAAAAAAAPGELQQLYALGAPAGYPLPVQQQQKYQQHVSSQPGSALPLPLHQHPQQAPHLPPGLGQPRPSSTANWGVQSGSGPGDRAAGGANGSAASGGGLGAAGGYGHLANGGTDVRQLVAALHGARGSADGYASAAAAAPSPPVAGVGPGPRLGATDAGGNSKGQALLAALMARSAAQTATAAAERANAARQEAAAAARVGLGMSNIGSVVSETDGSLEPEEVESLRRFCIGFCQQANLPYKEDMTVEQMYRIHRTGLAKRAQEAAVSGSGGSSGGAAVSVAAAAERPTAVNGFGLKLFADGGAGHGGLATRQQHATETHASAAADKTEPEDLQRMYELLGVTKLSLYSEEAASEQQPPHWAARNASGATAAATTTGAPAQSSRAAAAGVAPPLQPPATSPPPSLSTNGGPPPAALQSGWAAFGGGGGPATGLNPYGQDPYGHYPYGRYMTDTTAGGGSTALWGQYPGTAPSSTASSAAAGSASSLMGGASAPASALPIALTAQLAAHAPQPSQQHQQQLSQSQIQQPRRAFGRPAPPPGFGTQALPAPPQAGGAAAAGP